MRLGEELGIVAWAWRATLTAASDHRVWSPLLLLTLLRAAALVLVLFFHLPFLAGAMGPIVRLLGGEDATHYPGHLYALPTVTWRISLVLFLLAGAWTLERVGRRFQHHLTAQRVDRPASSWRGLTWIVVALVAVDVLTSALVGGIPEPLRQSSKKIILATGMLEGGALMVTLFGLAYAAATLVFGGGRLRSALHRSEGIVREHLFATLILLITPLTLAFPLHFILQEIDLGARGVAPESLVVWLAVQLVIETLAAFALIGSTTAVRVWKEFDR